MRDAVVLSYVLRERERQRSLGHTDADDYADGTGTHLDRALLQCADSL